LETGRTANWSKKDQERSKQPFLFQNWIRKDLAEEKIVGIHSAAPYLESIAIWFVKLEIRFSGL